MYNTTIYTEHAHTRDLSTATWLQSQSPVDWCLYFLRSNKRGSSADMHAAIRLVAEGLNVPTVN